MNVSYRRIGWVTLKPKFHLAHQVTSRHDTTRSSASSRAVRQARHSQNAQARHVERVVSCRDVTWRAKWNLGLTAFITRTYMLTLSTLVILNTISETPPTGIRSLPVVKSSTCFCRSADMSVTALQKYLEHRRKYECCWNIHKGTCTAWTHEG